MIESSGNAHVASGGIYIHVERPTARRRFSIGSATIPPQGERIVRYLLDTYPDTRRFTDIVRATRLDRGYASRILTTFARAGLVSYERNAPVEVAYPAELFEAWQATPSRSIESMWFAPAATTQALAERINETRKGEVAFTGVFAASVLTQHLEPERVDVYVEGVREVAALAAQLGAERVVKGANLLFLVHRDPGVLTIGTRAIRGTQIVSPSQVYRDALQRGRGREREAANQFRRDVLKW